MEKATETLVGRVYEAGDALRSVGLSLKMTTIGFVVIGDFDRIEQVPNWDKNGTWSFYWKNGKTFLWNPGNNIFSECSEKAYERKLEQVEGEKNYWKSLHEGERQWAFSPVEKLQGWGLNNPDNDLFWHDEIENSAYGCDSETCSHSSHGEYESIYVLTPREGVKILCLGTLQTEWNDPEHDTYYEVRNEGQDPQYLKENQPFSYHHYIKFVPMEEVPHIFPNNEQLERAVHPQPEKPHTQTQHTRPTVPRVPRPPRPMGERPYSRDSHNNR